MCQSRNAHTYTLALKAEGVGAGGGGWLLRHSFAACPQQLEANLNFFFQIFTDVLCQMRRIATIFKY